MRYILVEYMLDKNDKKKPNFYFGGYNKKYADMINLTIRECAYQFDTKEEAEKTACALNKAGYEFQVEKIQEERL